MNNIFHYIRSDRFNNLRSHSYTRVTDLKPEKNSTSINSLHDKRWIV